MAADAGRICDCAERARFAASLPALRHAMKEEFLPPRDRWTVKEGEELIDLLMNILEAAYRPRSFRKVSYGRALKPRLPGDAAN